MARLTIFQGGSRGCADHPVAQLVDGVRQSDIISFRICMSTIREAPEEKGEGADI
jgi:hypothetical protein